MSRDMRMVEGGVYDEERAFYGERGLYLVGGRFEGAKDGESALKECADIKVENCYFDLRYPLWHVDGVEMISSSMTTNCRASLWYSRDIKAYDTKMLGIKAVRECRDVYIENCEINSAEWGWKSENVRLLDSDITSEYLLFMSTGVKFSNVKMRGKYSFQYLQGGEFIDSAFDTKDAWWHAKDVTITNCVVKGEYLGWYSDGLTFINCTIIGTQPLCYAKNLTLKDCTMIDTDLSFEKSEVEADIVGEIQSIKNVYSGRVIADSIGEVVLDDDKARAEIIVRK